MFLQQMYLKVQIKVHIRFREYLVEKCDNATRVKLLKTAKSWLRKFFEARQKDGSENGKFHRVKWLYSRFIQPLCDLSARGSSSVAAVRGFWSDYWNVSSVGVSSPNAHPRDAHPPRPRRLQTCFLN